MSLIEENRHKIKDTFRHYMAMMMEASGLKVDNDNYAEWDKIIDGIIEQTKAEIKEENHE